ISLPLINRFYCTLPGVLLLTIFLRLQKLLYAFVKFSVFMAISLSIFQTLTGDGEYDQTIRQSPELAEVLGPIDGMVQWAFLATYALVFVVSAVFMGGNAIYYFTRRKHVRAYLNETPAWVVDLLQRTAR
ncbi:MAG: hypothetical protein QF735_10915, partial [Phycisphaeraceae bacterium]|nr:hypothetical protein [Phycisphaeraceae bacterium]